MSKHKGGHWINMEANKRTFQEYKWREKARERDRNKNFQKQNANKA